MRKRTPLPLLAWCLAVLVLLQPLQALALSVTQGQPFGIPISLNSDEPFSELQISFSALEGLSFQGASGSMSHLGNGAFRSDTPITSGTITLTYRANDDAGPEQAVMVEGVVASGGEGEQRRYWGVGSSFRTEVSVAPAPPEEVWPETWTLVTPATCETPGLRQRVSNLGKVQEEVIPALGYDYGEWTLVRAATLDAVGLEQRVYQHDPAHIETRELPKLVQAWSGWMVVSMPTCELPGKEERVSIHDASINQNHRLSRWYARGLQGQSLAASEDALNSLATASLSQAAAEATFPYAF